MKKNNSISPEQSLVLRYGPNIVPIGFEFLQQVSKNEGARIIQLPDYKGVTLDLLDLSSLSRTKTFKDSLACITIAHCLQQGIKKFVFQSSGNTANALAVYSSDHNIKTLMIYPKMSRYKIDPSFIDNDLCISVECDLPEPEIKALTQELADELKWSKLPNYELQIEANKLRACFLLEQAKEYTWHSQALSSAYGIFGLYAGFEELKSEVTNKNYHSPKLFGIQQAAVCPFVQRIKGKTIAEEKIIEPTLFRSKPTEEMFEMMESIVNQYGGIIEPITFEEFTMYKDQAIDILKKVGISLGVKEGEVIEKSGLISLIGTLKGIDAGIIKPEESVLVAFTGGIRQSNENFVPQFELNIDNLDSVKSQIKTFISQ